MRDDARVDSEPVIAEATEVARTTVHESTTDEATQGTLDERTRETLRRLSRLIIEKTTEHEQNPEEKSASQDEAAQDEARDKGGDDSRSLKSFLKPKKPRAPVQADANKTQLVYMSKSERALRTYNYAKQAGTEEVMAGQLLKLAV